MALTADLDGKRTAPSAYALKSLKKMFKNPA